MVSTEYIRLMAAYTSWQNQNIYQAADTLSDAQRKRDRGAFFGSIHATLNHLLWGDQLWMHRLAGTPKPVQPDITCSVSTHKHWDALRTDRLATDQAIIEWALRVNQDDILGNLTWHSGIAQTEVCRPRWTLVVQLFNHGTHHRGQVHTMLTAAGAKPGDTDIQYLHGEHFSWPEL